jgi:hypothetical protein
MEKNNKKVGYTKKLLKFVKDRNTPVVVTKQGSLKNRRRGNSESLESYCFSGYNN